MHDSKRLRGWAETGIYTHVTDPTQPTQPTQPNPNPNPHGRPTGAVVASRPSCALSDESRFESRTVLVARGSGKQGLPRFNDPTTSSFTFLAGYRGQRYIILGAAFILPLKLALHHTDSSTGSPTTRQQKKTATPTTRR